MKKKIGQELVYSPQPNATNDEIMEVMRLAFFTTYPPALRTEKILTDLFNKLPEGAQRHFKLKDKE